MLLAGRQWHGTREIFHWLVLLKDDCSRPKSSREYLATKCASTGGWAHRNQKYLAPGWSYLPVKNIDGTVTTTTLEGIYYDPAVNYNLVSMAELASLNSESRFGKHQSSVHGPAGIHVPLVHTCNVYAIDTAGTPNIFASLQSAKWQTRRSHIYIALM